jgi:hypothetical protein
LLAEKDASDREASMCPARLFKLTAMRGFIKQYADAEFDPATISILEDAFELAWMRVQASKAPYGSDEYVPACRAIIATYIISSKSGRRRSPLAGGQRDPLFVPAKTKPKSTERIAKHPLLTRPSPRRACSVVSQRAMESKQFSAAIAAIKEKGVLSGARIERSEVGAPGEFDATMSWNAHSLSVWLGSVLRRCLRSA